MNRSLLRRAQRKLWYTKRPSRSESGRTTNATRRLVRGRTMLLAVAVATSAFVASSHPASASKIGRDASIRSCVSSSAYCSHAQRLDTFKRTTKVSMRCWIDGRWESAAYRSNRWFLVRRASDGYEGFIHSSTIPANQQTRVGWCRDSPRVRAGLEAAARLGQWEPTDSDVKAGGWIRKGPTTNGNAFGPLGDWSGDCAKLAWIAYRRAGGTSLFRGNAWPMFSRYWNHAAERGKGRLPRYGALVGWQGTIGHIAISIGGHRTASTIGFDNAKARNAYVSTKTNDYNGQYFGWVVPK